MHLGWQWRMMMFTLSKVYWSPHLSPQSSMSWLFIVFLAPSPRPYIDKALSFKVLGMGGDVERGWPCWIKWYFWGRVVTLLLPCHIPLPSVSSGSGFRQFFGFPVPGWPSGKSAQIHWCGQGVAWNLNWNQQLDNRFLLKRNIAGILLLVLLLLMLS